MNCACCRWRMEGEAPGTVPVYEEAGPWLTWARELVMWAAQDPWAFLFNVFLILSPFLLISIFLSYKLSREIEKKEKKKKKPVKGKKKKKGKLQLLERKITCARPILVLDSMLTEESELLRSSSG